MKKESKVSKVSNLTSNAATSHEAAEPKKCKGINVLAS